MSAVPHDRTSAGRGADPGPGSAGSGGSGALAARVVLADGPADDLAPADEVAPADDLAPTHEPVEPVDEPVEEARVRRVELIISLVLRIGVVASLLVVAAGVVDGMVAAPAQRSSPALEHRLLTGLAHYPHSFGALFTGLAHGDPAALVAAGLLLLVVTPVLRVAVSIFTFVYQRDPRFVVVTTFVLGVLIGSFFLGKAGG